MWTDYRDMAKDAQGPSWFGDQLFDSSQVKCMM